MKKILGNRRHSTILIGLLFVAVFAEALYISKLLAEKTTKNYEVNLVKINTEKDSVDYLKIKNDLGLVDNSVRQIHRFLISKNIPDQQIGILSQDSLASAVYLAKVSNRYSQYLVDLEAKLQSVPLGMPSDGYISSNFGNRKNPIPPKPKTVILQEKTPAAPAIQPTVIEEKDSLGNIVKRTVVPAGNAVVKNASPAAPKIREENNAPAEADQIQFHKGLDIAVAYGSDIRSTAAGTVIYAGPKGGYGNCVIVSHGNGLATLYGHLSQVLVEVNDQIKVGQVIAKSGNSGRSTGPHLHYEVHRNNTPVNPKLFLNL